MDYFGCALESTGPNECCDVCSGTVEPEPRKHQMPNPEVSFQLQHYFDSENAEETENCMPSLTTGLCAELANIVACEPERYQRGYNLAKEFPFLLESYIDNIKMILTDCLSRSMPLTGQGM